MFIDRIRAAVKEIAAQHPEGFTLNLTTMELVTTGIAVGHKETQDCYVLDTAIIHALYNLRNLRHRQRVGDHLVKQRVGPKAPPY